MIDSPPQSTAAVADTLSMVERGLARGPGEPLNTPIANPSIEQAVEGDAESAFSMTTANEDIVVSTAHAIGIRSSVTRPTLRRPQSHLTSASAVPTIIQPTDAMAPHNSSLRLSRMFTTLEVDLTLTRLQASIPAPIIDPEDNIKNFVAVAPAGGLRCLLVENNLISLKILEVITFELERLSVHITHEKARSGCSPGSGALVLLHTMAQKQ